MGRVWAYARVSSRDQNPQLQLDALEASGYDELVTETESGKRGVQRPAWEELLPKPSEGDTLKFWKSDRWGRSAGHVLTTVNELRERGVKVVSLTENFDLDTKEGRFMFAVLAAAAEYELELRAERQAEGIAAARRREAEGRMLPGKQRIGRPHAIGPAELATLRRLVDEGTSVTEAARTLKIGRSTAYAALAATPPAEPAGRPAPAGPALPARDDIQEPATEPESDHDRQEREWAEQAEREHRDFEARLKPVPEIGEGYLMAEWPDTGRYYLVLEGKRIGHAAKKPWTSQWEAHSAHGPKIPYSRTYRTRRQALTEVALHHRRTTPVM